MNIEELKKMSRIDRIRAMEVLWSSLLHENDDIDVPNWHEDILKKRKKMISDGSAEFISLSELKARQDG